MTWLRGGRHAHVSLLSSLCRVASLPLACPAHAPLLICPSSYTCVRHQREAATGYFDAISETITSGQSSTTALKGSTEAAQF